MAIGRRDTAARLSTGPNILGRMLPDTPSATSVAAIGLFILAIFCVLYFARSLIMPIVLAVLLSIVLRPLVRLLEKIRVPSHLGAAIVLIALIAIVVAGA